MPFQNAQWSVTDYGLESRKGFAGVTPTYEIKASQLDELRYDKFYDFPLHMSEKNWVDLELFCEAFAAALEFHETKLSAPIDPSMLQASFAAARKLATE